MKILPTIFFCLFSIVSTNISAGEIYQCKTSEGKIAYSDKQCADSKSQSKVDFKDIPWTRSLEASKPVGTKIIDIAYKNKDTIIKYAFYRKDELEKFMRSANRLSGMNVNLLKYKEPKNGGPGEASLLITTKEGILHGRKSSMEKSASTSSAK